MLTLLGMSCEHGGLGTSEQSGRCGTVMCCAAVPAALSVSTSIEGRSRYAPPLATTTPHHITIPAMIFADPDGKTSFKSPESDEGVPSPEQVSQH
jgi:hypothetical protein